MVNGIERSRLEKHLDVVGAFLQLCQMFQGFNTTLFDVKLLWKQGNLSCQIYHIRPCTLDFVMKLSLCKRNKFKSIGKFVICFV